MKRNTKSRVNNPAGDIAAISFCAVLFLVSVTCLANNLNSSLGKNTLNQIGTISFKYKTAQRKLSNSMTWDRLQNNSPIYDGDLIRTADLSQATIHFSDSYSAELEENTLIQAVRPRTSKEAATIKFEFGSILIKPIEKTVSESAKSGSDKKAEKPLIIQKGNTTIILNEDTEIKIQAAPKTDSAKVEVQQGTALIQIKEEGSRKVKEEVITGDALVENGVLLSVDYAKPPEEALTAEAETAEMESETADTAEIAVPEPEREPVNTEEVKEIIIAESSGSIEVVVEKESATVVAINPGEINSVENNLLETQTEGAGKVVYSENQLALSKNVIRNDYSSAEKWKPIENGSGKSNAKGIRFRDSVYEGVSLSGKFSFGFSGINIPDAFFESEQLSFKVIGDGNTYRLRFKTNRGWYYASFKTMKNVVITVTVNLADLEPETSGNNAKFSVDDVAQLGFSSDNSGELVFFDIKSL